MKLPNGVIPALVALFALLSVPLKEAFNFPAAHAVYDDLGAVKEEWVHKAEMIVSGVKCRGTANFFLSRYENQAGILDLEAYAADHKVIVTYDASRIDLDKIKAIGEAPVAARDGRHYRFFKIERVQERSGEALPHEP